MRKIVLRISPLAKLAVTAAMIGVALSVYARLRGNVWLNGVGMALLFGGALTYLIERFRSRRSRPD